MRTHRLPRSSQPIPAEVSSFLTEQERGALVGGVNSPFDWAVAVGRVLRAGRVPPELARAARRTAGLFDDPDALSELENEIAARVSRIAVALSSFELTTGSPADAWSIIGVRDDLESASVTLGTIGRFAPEAASEELLTAVERTERSVFLTLGTCDARVESIVDRIGTALSLRPDAGVRARVTSVSTSPTAGWWVSLAADAGAQFAMPLEFGALGESSSAPPVRLAARLFACATPATAAGDDEILEALENAASSEPVATLDAGRIVIRVCAPADDSADGDVAAVAGLSIECTDGYDRIQDVQLESSAESAPPPRRIPPLAWWITLRPLASVATFAIRIRTDRGEFRAAFERSEGAPT